MAINYHGAKWGDPQFGTPGGQVDWRFGNGTSALLPNAPYANPGAYAQEIRAAFDFWEGVTGIDFVEVAGTAADLAIGWTAIDGAYGTLGTASWSYFVYGNGNQIANATVRFDTAEPWDLGGGPLDFFAVALHEIGHAVGLGHSANTGSLMYPELRPGAAPSAEDIAAAREIYGVRSSTPLPTAEPGDVFRFYDTASDTHFYTASAAERDTVSATLPRYRYEGNAFDALEDARGDVEVFRFYNRDTGTHFYTASEAERDAVRAGLPQYEFEGAAYRASSDSEGGQLDALHRFYNERTGSHFYTSDENEVAGIMGSLPQYRYEGIAYYVDFA